MPRSIFGPPSVRRCRRGWFQCHLETNEVEEDQGENFSSSSSSSSSAAAAAKAKEGCPIRTFLPLSPLRPAIQATMKSTMTGPIKLAGGRGRDGGGRRKNDEKRKNCPSFSRIRKRRISFFPYPSSLHWRRGVASSIGTYSAFSSSSVATHKKRRFPMKGQGAFSILVCKGEGPSLDGGETCKCGRRRSLNVGGGEQWAGTSEIENRFNYSSSFRFFTRHTKSIIGESLPNPSP